jgi:hypothetical protein
MKTDRRLSLVSALVLTLFLVSTTLAISRAADYTNVGVKSGDWVAYSYTMTSSSTGSVSGTARVDITQVIGTYVMLTFKVTYSGYTVTQSYNGDISTNSGGICAYVIAAGLNAGDPLYMNAPMAINETKSVDIAGASRTVNCYEIGMSGTSVEMWYDQGTGMLLKDSLVSPTLSITVIATSSSAFPENLAALLVIGGGAAILVLVAVVVLAVSRHRRRGAQVVVVPVALTSSGPTKSAAAPKKTGPSSESVCPFCGATLVPGAAFCRSCGTKLV